MRKLIHLANGCSSALACGLGVTLLVAAPLAAQVDTDSPATPTPAGDADDLAKKLANPVSNLISVPLQSNFDFDAVGDEDGVRYTLNVQPVIPISLGDDWNLITRTIVPIIGQNESFSALTSDSEFGIGDLVASGFFSRKQSTPLTNTASLTGVSAPSSSSRPPPRTCWAPTSSASARPASPSLSTAPASGRCLSPFRAGCNGSSVK